MRKLAATTLLLLAACATPGPDMQRCTNTRHGFSVAYPAAWYTNSGEVMPACSAFHSDPFELPPQSEIPFEIAVVIGVEEVPIERVVESSEWERVLSAERMNIGGRDAYRVEAESTGEGLADRGMRSLRYVIDLGGGRTLIATTHDANRAYEHNKDVLARMIQTITLPPSRN